MSEYKLTIGLEVHAELKTETKMFCNSKNDSDEEHPNTNICPICLGYPGTLPAINKEAVGAVLRFGVAVGGKIASTSQFDRKNYFYPDIPKGYQISQYKNPLVVGGSLADVKLTRVHLEEDTARSTHDSGKESENYSLLDFNRAGVPLMELVTEPVIKTREEAVNFARELQLLLQYLKVSDANMEKGEMRVEANISVSKDEKFGTKVEVKNINSFKAVAKSIEFEFNRQVGMLEKNEKVVQETRGWDENRGETVSQRLKESAHDYRYFPDPDLPKLFIRDIPEFTEKILTESLPELPWEKRNRYKKDYGLKDEDVEIYVRQPEWGTLLDKVAKVLKKNDLIQLASNYITSDLKTPIPADKLAEVVRMISSVKISSWGAKEILRIIEKDGGEPEEIAEKNNLIQKSDEGELKKIVEDIINQNADVVTEYKSGKQEVLQFLIGQAMKATKGSGNPQVLKKIFIETL